MMPLILAAASITCAASTPQDLAAITAKQTQTALIFFASWCRDCSSSLTPPAGTTPLYIAVSDQSADAAKTLKLAKATGPCLLNSTFAAQYGVQTIPATIVIDAKGKTVNRVAAKELPVLHQLPSFELRDQDGHNVTLSSLKGKIWVADFIYTSCGDECPLMTTKMRSVQLASAHLNKLEFISITTDPRRDTPAVLKSYAARFKIDEANWRFLTGDKKAIVSLSTKGFWLPASEARYNHTQKFALVDGSGKIRGYYQSTDPAAMKALQNDLERLSAANGI